MKLINKVSSLLLFISAIASMPSCNSDFDVKLSDQNYSDSTNVKATTRKVLYLIVDGVRGQVVKDMNAPTISSVIKNSTYSWYSLSDSLSTDANGWADLMTGVTKLKHEVKDAGFTGSKLDKYPSFFAHIKNANSSIRIASFASSADFKNNFAGAADASSLLSTDAEVKSSIVSELSNDNAQVVVGQFKEVNVAGAQSGYEFTSTPYRNAILQFDTYLSEILAALKARKNYSNEDWLVVITSNHGGDAVIPPAQNDETILSYPKANILTILYNPNYKQRQILKPFAGNKFPAKFLKWNQGTANTDVTGTFAKTSSSASSLYNFGIQSSFTIEAKVRKVNRGGGNPWRYQWPIFLCKKDTSVTARVGKGWSFQLENNRWRFLVKDSINRENWIEGPDWFDANWHHIAVTVYTGTDGKRVMRAFHDGKRIGGEKAFAIANISFDNSQPLRLGFYHEDGEAFNQSVADVRIWRINLPDDIVATYACDTKVLSTHPYYDFLAGNWPLTDGSGTILRDESMFGNNMTLKLGTGQALQWVDLNNIICPPSSSNLGVLVPRTYDMPRQILSWLALPIPETLKLDGRVWLNY